MACSRVYTQIYVVKYSQNTYKTISTVPIPLALDERLSSVYDDQLKYGIQLPAEIQPMPVFTKKLRRNLRLNLRTKH